LLVHSKLKSLKCLKTLQQSIFSITKQWNLLRFGISYPFSVDFCLSFARAVQNYENFALEPLENNHFEHFLELFHSRWVINITDNK
jgi:hypothetical protein